MAEKTIDLETLSTSGLTNLDKYLTKAYLELELKGQDFADYIKNKIVPTKVSAFENDSGYITESGTLWTTLQGKISAAATSTNQLVDKKYVDDHVSGSLATFIGSFNTKAEFVTTIEAAAEGTYKNGDYAVVLVDETNGGTVDTEGSGIIVGETWRYKYNGTSWAAEYRVNETALTSAQLAAINSGISAEKLAELEAKQDALSDVQLAAVNSGITAEKVATYDAYETGKQDALTFATTSEIVKDSTSDSTVTASVISEVLFSELDKKQDNLTFITGSQFNDGELTEEEKTQTVNAGALSQILESYSTSEGFDTTPTEGHTTYMISSDTMFTIVSGLLKRIEDLESRVNTLTEGSHISYATSTVEQNS